MNNAFDCINLFYLNNLVTPRPSTCAQQQGACMDDCAAELQRDIATDCGANQKCCVLV